MPEAVIVAAARSPIGRASKGSLVECRPDDLTVAIVRAVLAMVPQLDPGAVQDLLLGCAEPAGESGFNLARVVAILAGMPNVPGVMVNRLCSSSLETIRMAFHAIKAGEGDIFLTAGVETVSRLLGTAWPTLVPTTRSLPRPRSVLLNEPKEESVHGSPRPGCQMSILWRARPLRTSAWSSM